MSKRILLAAIIAIAIIVALNYNPSDDKVTKDTVLATLKDPSSAQFRNIHKSLSGSTCGEVNTKNGFGGYIGYRLFQIVNGEVIMERDELEDQANADMIKLLNETIHLSCD